ncbi:undecaprenyl-diphosphate phosphatase [Bdellovibrionota bacterium FG-2]
MTLFQSIIYAIIHGFSEFVPVSSSAHQFAITYFLGWTPPPEAALLALNLGALLAILGYFIHDWASMISSTLQVILFRRRPMTMDERLPLFILIATIPLGAAWHTISATIAQITWTPLLYAESLAAFGLPLWIADSLSKKNKRMLDWNWFDSIAIGIAQLTALIPGCGFSTSAMAGGLLRNYSREAAAKFTFFIMAPVLAAKCVGLLRDPGFTHPSAGSDYTWLTFSITLLVTLLTSLLVIGGILKHNDRGLRSYTMYRCLLGLSIGVIYWYRSTH